MLQAAFLHKLDWFVPPQARTDAATLGRARIFAFSHVFGPFLGHAITTYLYYTDKNRELPFWVIVTCISLFWTMPLGLKFTGRLQQLALFSVANLTFVTLYGSYYYGGLRSSFLSGLLSALFLVFFYLWEMLLEDAELNDDEQSEDLRRINSAGKHLLSLVTDVLDMSKIEADKTELVIQPFELLGFLEDVIATSRSVVEANGNEFLVERGAGLGIAISDATRLRQPILNLLSNAGKFTKNGRVTLQISREKGDAEDWIRIAVSDTGIGISPDNLQKLFQDFNQAEASTSSKYGGTGLGLALSQNLCRMMGGDISVESEVGRGSRFTIRVPGYIEDHQLAGGTSDAPASNTLRQSDAA